MFLSKTLQFYKKREIQKLLVEYAKNKEVAIRFTDYFGKRPDTLMYENDVLDLAKKKATSFHCSEELWSNPLQLRTDIKKQEMNELRIGWDLILDIDCHHFIYSKIATHLLVKILKDLGLKSVTCKFSGNKGFHIAVPYEAFPDEINGTKVKDLFPEAPRRIAYYLRDKLRPLLETAILKVEKNKIENIMKRTGAKYKELVMETDEKSMLDDETKPKLNVDAFLEIDTILIAPRHLYRMPYSTHEKSELVSVPVNTNKILSFKKSQAEPKNVKTNEKFLDRKNAKPDEAHKLFLNAFDFSFKEENTKKKINKEFTIPEKAIIEELFPPCIRMMLTGMQDGKKRTLFTLINFYKGAGWSIGAIEQRIEEWNKQNPESLREVYLNGQIRQAKKVKEAIPPHNCKRYYQDLGVCHPDTFCSKIKNPLQYAKLKAEMETTKTGAKKSRLTPEQLEARRKFREKKKKEKKKETEEKEHQK